MRAIWMPLLAIGMASAANAQDRGRFSLFGAPAPAGISGSVRASYWSSDRDLSAGEHFAAGSFWLKAEGKYSAGVSYLAEGWAAARAHEGRASEAAELREGYIDLRIGNFDTRIGRQIIAWGRADGINPTDRLSPNDLRALVPENDDRRMGTSAVRTTYYADRLAMSAYWLPSFRANRISLPPEVAGAVEERERWVGESWALRVEETGRAIDWSISYARVLDVSPDLIEHRVPGGQPWIELAHHQIRSVGVDVAGTLGRFGLRGEAAFLQTEDANGLDPRTKNREVFVVAGADRTFAGDWNVNLQYLFKQVFGFRDASTANGIAWQQSIFSGQAARVQHGMSARVGTKWLHDTFEADLSGAGYFGPRGFVIRPKLSYAVTDQLRLLAGTEIYRGDEASLFGLLRPNSTAYVEMRVTF
jgi:hypothetical protein